MKKKPNNRQSAKSATRLDKTSRAAPSLSLRGAVLKPRCCIICGAVFYCQGSRWGKAIGRRSPSAKTCSESCANKRVVERKKHRYKSDLEFRNRDLSQSSLWRKNNPERISELNKIWRKNNLDKISAINRRALKRKREWARRRYQNDPEYRERKLLEAKRTRKRRREDPERRERQQKYQKKYQTEHRKKYRDNRRKWYKENSERILKQMREQRSPKYQTERLLRMLADLEQTYGTDKQLAAQRKAIEQDLVAFQNHEISEGEAKARLSLSKSLIKVLALERRPAALASDLTIPL